MDEREVEKFDPFELEEVNFPLLCPKTGVPCDHSEIIKFINEELDEISSPDVQHCYTGAKCPLID